MNAEAADSKAKNKFKVDGYTVLLVGIVLLVLFALPNMSPKTEVLNNPQVAKTQEILPPSPAALLDVNTAPATIEDDLQQLTLLKEHLDFLNENLELSTKYLLKIQANIRLHSSTSAPK